MKKAVIICTALTLVLICAVLIAALIISFKTVKPATDAINRDLEKYFSKIVYIPQGIPRPTQTFNETSYFWEMETPQGEVTAIKLKYNPAFTKDEDTIEVILEMPENGDPSIFDKVLPAVIADKQSLDSAQDPQKANLGTNENAGYNKISLFTKKETNQTTKIVWDFKKEQLEDKLNEEYKKLYLYPTTLLKILYNVPHVVIDLLSAG